MSKCFCHLNGYEVKDKEARTALNNINAAVETLQTDVETLKNSVDDTLKLHVYNVTLRVTTGNQAFFGFTTVGYGNASADKFKELITKNGKLLFLLVNGYYVNSGTYKTVYGVCLNFSNTNKWDLWCVGNTTAVSIDTTANNALSIQAQTLDL